mmetsp:Transcript_25444/g.59242  ORF Transcript_25444/g.59242 Transcript_25444/m.59242 type:complete len:582 (-) Transcript_25444:59-1804(-)
MATLEEQLAHLCELEDQLTRDTSGLKSRLRGLESAAGLAFAFHDEMLTAPSPASPPCEEVEQQLDAENARLRLEAEELERQLASMSSSAPAEEVSSQDLPPSEAILTRKLEQVELIHTALHKAFLNTGHSLPLGLPDGSEPIPRSVADDASISLQESASVDGIAKDPCNAVPEVEVSDATALELELSQLCNVETQLQADVNGLQSRLRSVEGTAAFAYALHSENLVAATKPSSSSQKDSELEEERSLQESVGALLRELDELESQISIAGTPHPALATDAVPVQEIVPASAGVSSLCRKLEQAEQIHATLHAAYLEMRSEKAERSKTPAQDELLEREPLPTADAVPAAAVPRVEEEPSAASPRSVAASPRLTVSELEAELEKLRAAESELLRETDGLKTRLRNVEGPASFAFALHAELRNSAASAQESGSAEEPGLRQEVESLRQEAEDLERRVATSTAMALRSAGPSPAKRQAEKASSDEEEEFASPGGMQSDSGASQSTAESPMPAAKQADKHTTRKLLQMEQLLRPMHDKVKELNSTAASPAAVPLRCRPLGRSQATLRQRAQAIKLMVHRYQLRSTGC